MTRETKKQRAINEVRADRFRFWAAVPAGEKMKATYEISKMVYRAKRVDVDTPRSMTVVRYVRKPRSVSGQ